MNLFLWASGSSGRVQILAERFSTEYPYSVVLHEDRAF
jgi:hypothetical protein